MRFVLGLDQGGSKTAAVAAAEDGSLLGLGLGRGACYAYMGMDAAMDGVREACAAAAARAGLALERFSALTGGLTGADFPDEHELLANEVRGATGISDVTVVNDCIIAMRGGTDRDARGVICAGSGLNAAVHAPDGREIIFGYHVAEEDQGGAALGKAALRAVFDADCGLAPPTALTELVLRRYGAPDVENVFHEYYATHDVRDLADLPPLIFSAADGGDAVAAGILERFGRRVARYVTVGLRRLGLGEAESDVVLSGGVFKARGILRLTVEDAVRAVTPRARVVDAEMEPVAGAALLALERLYGGRLPRAVEERLRAGCASLRLLRTDGKEAQ